MAGVQPAEDAAVDSVAAVAEASVALVVEVALKVEAAREGMAIARVRVDSVAVDSLAVDSLAVVLLAVLPAVKCKVVKRVKVPPRVPLARVVPRATVPIKLLLTRACKRPQRCLLGYSGRRLP